jgi:hypothetical protein
MFVFRNINGLPKIRALALVLMFAGAGYGATTVDFEQFKDGAQLTNQISGLQITNATVATVGISLNEFEFPPHSGVNAAFDDGGPITILFATPLLEFDGYFTYTTALSLDAFGVGQQIVASEVSKFSSNLALSGDPGSSPNEFFQLTSTSGISRVTITGDPAGGSFAVDDLSFQTRQAPAIPEPKASSLVVAGLLVALFLRLRPAIWEN